MTAGKKLPHRPILTLLRAIVTKTPQTAAGPRLDARVLRPLPLCTRCIETWSISMQAAGRFTRRTAIPRGQGERSRLRTGPLPPGAHYLPVPGGRIRGDSAIHRRRAGVRDLPAQAASQGDPRLAGTCARHEGASVRA